MSQQINLFNPIFLKTKKYFSAATMAQALGLILLGCFGVSGFASYQLSRLAEDAKAANDQLQLVQVQLNTVNAGYAARQKSQTLEAEVLQAEAEVTSLRQVADVLKNAEFSNTKGHAEYMRAFSRQIVNGVWLTGFSIDSGGTQIGLNGRALRPELVPMYINRLKQEPVLKGKSFAALEMQSPLDEQSGTAASRGFAPYIEFSLQSSMATGEQGNPSGVKK